MLIAIGVYKFAHKLDDNTPSLVFKQVATVFKNQGNLFFSDNPLNSFDTKIQPQLTDNEMQHTSILHYQPDREHYYVKRIDDNNAIVLMSRTALDPLEAHYLFINTAHAYKRPEKAKVTLKQIFDNPLGYTGKDCYFQAIQQTVEETKTIVLQDLEKILERGERLERLEDNTVKLQQASVAFEAEAKKLNSRCCGMW